MTKKYKARIGDCCTVATMLLVAILANSAQAQVPTGIGTPVVDAASVTNSFIGDTVSKIQRAFGAAVPVGAAGLQSQIATNNADNQNNNAKQNLDIKHDMELLKHNTPSSYSACDVAAGAAAQKGANDGAASMAQSLVKSNGSGGPAGPSADAADVKADNAAGTCPAQGDPMYAWAQKAGCTNSSNAGAATTYAVCSAEALQMPSSYQGGNGYTPSQGTDPWSLAYKGCQKLLPRHAPSNGAGTGGFQYGEYATLLQQARGGYEACMAELDKRSIPNSNYSSTSQAYEKQCKADAKAHLNDGDCSKLSALKLEHNSACITSFADWQHNGTVGMTPGEKVSNGYAGAQSCAAFQSAKQKECIDTINKAVAAAKLAEAQLQQLEAGNLEQKTIAAIEEQSKKQTALLNDTLQKLTNQMQQLQAAIKSPDSKVPVSYTHKISTQVEN